jgi:hypothetical protein
MPESHTLIKWFTYGQNDRLLQREQMLEIATGFPYGHILQALRIVFELGIGIRTPVTW